MGADMAGAGGAECARGGGVGASSSSRSSGGRFSGRTLGNDDGARGAIDGCEVRSDTEGGGRLDDAADAASSLGGRVEADAPSAVLRSRPRRFFAAQVFGSAPRFF
jgi:hypothetical protein